MNERRLGRPVDPSRDEAILAATRELVVTLGYDKVTTQAIASRAGASKQTLYRRWPSKHQLVFDAFLAQAVTEVDAASAGKEHSGNNLRAFLDRTFAAATRVAPALRGLMAHAQTDEAFCRSFRDEFIVQRRAALAEQLHRFAPGASQQAVECAVLMIYGAMWYRLLLDEPLDDDLAASLTHCAGVQLKQ